MLFMTYKAGRAPLGRQGHSASSWPKLGRGGGGKRLGSERGQVRLRRKIWPKTPGQSLQRVGVDTAISSLTALPVGQ